MKGHNNKRRYYAWQMDPQGVKDAGVASRAEQAVLPKKGEHLKDTSNVPNNPGHGLTRNERMALKKKP